MNKKILFFVLFLALAVRILSIYLTPVKGWDETVYANLGYDLKTNPFDYSFDRLWSDKDPDWPRAGYKAPLLPYSLSILYLLFGDGNILIDLFIPIIGTLGILFLYILLKEMYDEKIAFYSSVLLAFVPLNEITSGRILTDSFVTTLVTLSILFFWKGFEKKNNKSKIACGFFSALAVLSRYNAIVLPVIFLIYLIIKNRRLNFLKEKYMIITIVVFFLALTPLFWYGYKNYGTPLGAFIHSSESITYYGGVQPWYFYFTYSNIMLFLFSCAFLSLFFILKNKKLRFKRNNILISLWFVLFLLLSIYFPHKEERFILPLVPTLTTLISIGIARLKYERIIFLFILSLLIFTTILEFKELADLSYTQDAFCFLEASNFLKNTEKNSVIITDSSSLVYYYTRKETHFFKESLNDNIKLIEDYYPNRPSYILLSNYESERKDFKENLNSSNFNLVFSCPMKKESALVFRWVFHQN
jgi:4-amino-4-deoxy-L-arabinose transferase-like glycosyltransferase